MTEMSLVVIIVNSADRLLGEFPYGCLVKDVSEQRDSLSVVLWLPYISIVAAYTKSFVFELQH